ncbi:LuxR C-terminal-related transcriptional regulator [Neobacillus sp. LXY-1]|uniref:LuxR C-terminal-related transcriptional regulator n=1 Tax=Neobacillus sp. LXY-1 TaxID=3379133 RepID=UPI003EE23924
MIPEDMQPALLGTVPSTLITCDENGVPNITNIARVWYVDQSHVAIANHMLNKSIKNLQNHPLAFFRTTDTNRFITWEIEAEYVGPMTNGSIYQEMKKQYEVLSMMFESDLPITFRNAELFQVTSVRICEEENIHLLTDSEIYDPILELFEKKFNWDSSSVWMYNSSSKNLKLGSIRGVDGELATNILKRVAEWTIQQNNPIRIYNMKSQYQYAATTFLHQQNEQENFSQKDYTNVKHHYVSIPIYKQNDDIIGVICSQSNDFHKFSPFSEELLMAASRYLSQLVENIPLLRDSSERQKSIEMVLGRILLEQSKRKGEVKSVLSPRELQVAIQVAKGFTNEEIAKALFLSKRTVTTHLERIFQKLEISSRTALASHVLENGLTDPKN